MRLKLDGFVYNQNGVQGGAEVFQRDIGTVAVGNSGNVILDGVLFISLRKIGQLFWTN
jgi:hypothetical protein